MGKRIKLGVVYTYNEGWIAGTYYVENLVKSLNLIEDDKKPNVVILVDKEQDIIKFKRNVQYPYLTFKFFKKEPKGIYRLLNIITWELFKKTIFNFRLSDKDVDIVLPLRVHQNFFEKISNKIYWIPDLQEKIMPHFFDDKEIEWRDNNINKIIKTNQPIIFSSESAAKDFKQYYQCENITSVVHFAVHHPNLSNNNWDVIKQKYSIESSYFIVSNQFWQHKNHKIVIEAISSIKDPGFKVIFTGQPTDYRNQNYYDELCLLMKNNGIDNYIANVGFVKREEQLLLMKNSIAVVQPSLFEGWSTVIEDAKALNVQVIASDIKVHREQLANDGLYFDPYNKDQLAKHMQDIYSIGERSSNIYPDYSYNQKMFGVKYFNVIQKSINKN